MKNRLFLGLLMVVLLGSWMSARADFFKFKKRVPLETVQITAEFDANSTTPTLMHLVVVFDPDLLKELGKLKGPQYFEKANDIINDHPDLLEVTEWEVAPGQVIPRQGIIIRGNAPYGGLIFARFMSAGDHRVKVGKQKHIKLRLLKDKMVIVHDDTAKKRDKKKK